MRRHTQETLSSVFPFARFSNLGKIYTHEKLAQIIYALIGLLIFLLKPQISTNGNDTPMGKFIGY